MQKSARLEAVFLIKILTELDGVSGCEDEVRGFIKSRLSGIPVTEDALGNLIFFKKGTKSDKKVMLCAHMDEVGFIAGSVTDDGFIKFRTVGGFDGRILPGLKVRVGKNKYSGVIGTKPIHLTKSAEREKPIAEDELYIDIGTSAKGLVNKGDYIALDSDYVEFGDGLFKAKAIDDRAGCAALIELLEENKSYPYDLYVCFSVQEEVGLRGAKVLAQRIMPDIAVAIETTTCSDTAEKPYVTVLGKGPAVSVADGASYSLNDLRELALDISKKENIPVQIKTAASGGNDAGAFQRIGAKSFVISLPTRYIHSPSSAASLEDFYNYKKLIKAFAERADEIETF